MHGGAVASVAEILSVACARTVVGKEKELFLGESSTSYLSSAPDNVSTHTFLLFVQHYQDQHAIFCIYLLLVNFLSFSLSLYFLCGGGLDEDMCTFSLSLLAAHVHHNLIKYFPGSIILIVSLDGTFSRIYYNLLERYLVMENSPVAKAQIACKLSNIQSYAYKSWSAYNFYKLTLTIEFDMTLLTCVKPRILFLSRRAVCVRI